MLSHMQQNGQGGSSNDALSEARPSAGAIIHFDSSLRSSVDISSSEDLFERVSDDNGQYMQASFTKSQKVLPVLATAEKTACYTAFDEHPVRVEGPEFSQDFTYYLINLSPDLANFERGIPVGQFSEALIQKRIELEFRTLQKMCFHKDHVLNLFTSFDIQFHKINRYKDILPFLHNRVVLRDNPILPPLTAGGDSQEDSDSDFNRGPPDTLIEIHGSDPRLQTYFNASYINSLIKSKQAKGSSYIASSSPGLKTATARCIDDDAEQGPAQTEATEAQDQQQEVSVEMNRSSRAAGLKPIGPCPSFANFWQMVWDNDIHLIVMLCPIIGLLGVEESCLYWDQIYQDSAHRVTVKDVTEKTTPTPGVTKRVIHLQRRDRSDAEAVTERVIEHYQMQSWADNTAIEENSEQFAALNHLLNKVFVAKREKPESPILVHCSAGIGRTGTFLSLCLMIEAIKELQRLKRDGYEQSWLLNSNETGVAEASSEEVKKQGLSEGPGLWDQLVEPRVSIFGTVRKLREQRCYMVKKQSQYVFLYTYMDLWIKNDLENGADPDQVLFNFGAQSSTFQKRQI